MLQDVYTYLVILYDCRSEKSDWTCWSIATRFIMVCQHGIGNTRNINTAHDIAFHLRKQPLEGQVKTFSFYNNTHCTSKSRCIRWKRLLIMECAKRNPFANARWSYTGIINVTSFSSQTPCGFPTPTHPHQRPFTKGSTFKIHTCSVP